MTKTTPARDRIALAEARPAADAGRLLLRLELQGMYLAAALAIALLGAGRYAVGGAGRLNT